MKKYKVRYILFFVGGALIAFGLFNLMAHYLESVEILPVPWYAATPFVLLLLSIAILPFINRHWWERRYPVVAFTLGAVIVLYYIFVVQNSSRLFLTFYEYISFISLIGSLFVVSGGIHLRIQGKATPWENVSLLGIGAVISNILGTTGASMLLIRPYIRGNRYRIRAYHVIFFIFIVSNIGGALTPIGDPPLFLGYLKGIPFFWLIDKAWYIWAFTVGLVLAIFYVIDSYNFKQVPSKLQASALHPEESAVSGLQNVVFLLIILGAVFIEKPILMREVLMWSAAIASYYTTNREVHRKNEFNFVPIKEVAILFAGIFATMIPALDWLELNSRLLGIVTPVQYFWATGSLSAFLDNAPTYLNFLSAAFGLHGASLENSPHVHAILGLSTPAALGLANPIQPDSYEITTQTWRYVLAISLGAVFFGALTYIGNGPNFMVKSIAEQSKIPMPTFFGYLIKYSIPVLIPVFILVWLLFL